MAKAESDGLKAPVRVYEHTSWHKVQPLQNEESMTMECFTSSLIPAVLTQENC